MSTTKPKKKFDNQRNRLHAIAKEFAEKIKDNLASLALLPSLVELIFISSYYLNWMFQEIWNLKFTILTAKFSINTMMVKSPSSLIQ